MIKSQHGNYHPAQLGIVLGLIVIAIGWFAYKAIYEDKEISCTNLEAMTLILEKGASYDKINELYKNNCSQSIGNNNNKIKITSEALNNIKKRIKKEDLKVPYVMEKYSEKQKISNLTQSVLNKINEIDILNPVFDSARKEYLSINKAAMISLLIEKDSPFFKIRTESLSISKEPLPKGLLASYEVPCNSACINKIVSKESPSEIFEYGSVDSVKPDVFNEVRNGLFAYPSNDQCYLFANGLSPHKIIHSKCAVPIEDDSNHYYLYLIRREPPPLK